MSTAPLPPGTPVRVRDAWPERDGPCHIRTPHYLRGRTGTIERALGTFPNPEDLAFARPAARRALYHVRFDQPSLWNEGRAGDTLLVEIFEHWLNPAPPDAPPSAPPGAVLDAPLAAPPDAALATRLGTSPDAPPDAPPGAPPGATP